ncbi:MAG: hypothetical protein D6765_03190, partial [Bacteroidetes bacterium]
AGGDLITFSGRADDAEDGTLPPDALTWWIDFHHDDHTHPALEPLHGVAQGSFLVPQIGEIDDNVWYRIYLEATDSEGLSKTTFVDVFPRKTTFSVLTEPAGLQLSVDGKTVTAPATTVSVVGIQRAVRAIQLQSLDEQLYLFDSWQDGSTDPIFSFLAPEEPQEITARYLPLSIGSGTGLEALYYIGPPTFQAPPVLVRIDTTVNFDWDDGSPAPQIPVDNFHVRWQGTVEPYLSAEHTFYVTSDDGVRLWVNDQLLIDQWVPQPPTETQGSIFLDGGQRYNIRLEYFEQGGGALVQLSWSNPRLPKEIIPRSQLYPTVLTNPTGTFGFQLVPNPTGEDLVLDVLADVEAPFRYEIFNPQGQRLLRGRFDIAPPERLVLIELPDDLPPGMYFLKLYAPVPKVEEVLRFVKH